MGPRRMLAKAVEAELATFLAKHADLKTEDGRSRIVRHGHLPEREVMTSIGLLRCASRACVTVGPALRMPGAFASRQRSCRPTRAAPEASKC
jgi:hypothetical protein